MAVWLATLAGCATPQPSLPDAATMPAATPAYVALGEPAATQPSAAVSVQDLVTWKPMHGRYQWITPNRPAKTVGYTLRQEGADGSPSEEWRMALTGKRATQMMRDGDGTVRILSETDHDEKVIVTYDPPLVMLPATLAPGAPFEGQAKMDVRNLSNGASREKGACVYRVELMGRQQVETPAGTFDAVLVRTRRTMTLTLARAEVVMVTAYVRGRPPVAETVLRKTRPLGLVEMRQTEELRLER